MDSPSPTVNIFILIWLQYPTLDLIEMKISRALRRPSLVYSPWNSLDNYQIILAFSIHFHNVIDPGFIQALIFSGPKADINDHDCNCCEHNQPDLEQCECFLMTDFYKTPKLPEKLKHFGKKKPPFLDNYHQ